MMSCIKVTLQYRRTDVSSYTIMCNPTLSCTTPQSRFHWFSKSRVYYLLSASIPFLSASTSIPQQRFLLHNIGDEELSPLIRGISSNQSPFNRPFNVQNTTSLSLHPLKTKMLSMHSFTNQCQKSRRTKKKSKKP